MNARDELFAAVYPIVVRQIEAGARPTPQTVSEFVTSLGAPLSLMNPHLQISDDDYLAVARRIETLIDIELESAVVIEKGYEAWLDERRASIEPYYWDRYRALLGQRGLPPSVCAEIGSGTDRVLDLLRDPTAAGSWDRRGLVVGNVQSGKTAHYTGLVCKAADAGFKVIIIIAGIHNNLRNQTQKRIDEGFIGEHRVRELTSVRRESIGVGKISSERRPIGFTSSNQDFTKATADAMGARLSAFNEPAVFVIKKNPTTLRNLIAWLKPTDGSGITEPLLLIDDEADNASINVAYSKNDISTINDLIRRLLRMFDKSAYVGYTATPFANIFIDPTSDDEMVADDLFPRSFIVSLDAPTNYVGAKRIFLDTPTEFLEWIKDSEDLLPVRHKKDHPVVQLPNSLVDAVRAFVLTRAIRIGRGDGREHSSMLINASRFVGVQQDLKTLVLRRLEDMKDAVRMNHALSSIVALADPEIGELKRVFDDQFSDADVVWPDVLAQLWEAAAPIRVVSVNSQSSDHLNYDEYSNGLHVIAVGGLALSRGLTLEGLSTTYFLRNSQMYDTLLQMGRWFGYRPGYEDLCRIWMTETVAGWYAHVAESVEELREELRKMASEGRSPEDFGLKVRSHPAALIVTARNKMGAGETRTLRIGLAERNIQTRALNADHRTGNIAAARRLLKALTHDGADWSAGIPVKGGTWFQDVPLALVHTFLEEFSNSSYSILTDPDAVLAYIDERPEEMEFWDLFVAHLVDSERGYISEALGKRMTLRQRTVDIRDNVIEFRKSNFVDPADERVGLTPEQIALAEEAFRQRNQPGGSGYNYSALTYRQQRKSPQLGLHLMKLTDDADRDDDDNPAVILEPWLAWNISFPDTEHENLTTTYVVNAIWHREYLDAEDADQEDDDED